MDRSPAASPAQRIAAAADRIEAALRDRTGAEANMAQRHAALKARMAEAVAALDELIARGAD